MCGSCRAIELLEQPMKVLEGMALRPSVIKRIRQMTF